LITISDEVTNAPRNKQSKKLKTFCFFGIHGSITCGVELVHEKAPLGKNQNVSFIPPRKSTDQTPSLYQPGRTLAKAHSAATLFVNLAGVDGGHRPGRGKNNLHLSNFEIFTISEPDLDFSLHILIHPFDSVWVNMIHVETASQDHPN